MQTRALWVCACALVCAGGAPRAVATVSFATAGGSISQSFDTLTSGSSIVGWSNNTTLPGWYLFRQPGPGTAVSSYTGSNGSSAAATFFSFGGAGVNPASDRSLGAVGSGLGYWGSPADGSVAGWMSVGITNDTGITLTDFTVDYDGEQWRNGGNTSAQSISLEYGYGATFTAVASWFVAGASFDFTSPIVGSTAGALDGNAGANRVAGIGGSIGSQSWAAGDTLWIRWVEVNDPGNDHGLSIDNWSFSATPAPGPVALLGLAGPMVFRRRR